MLNTDSTEKENVSYSIICCTHKLTLFMVDLTHAPFRPYFYKKVTIQVFK